MTTNRAQVPAAAGVSAGARLPWSATERTRHRRLWHLGRADRESLHAVLRAGLVAHLGVIIDGWPTAGAAAPPRRSNARTRWPRPRLPNHSPPRPKRRQG